MKTRSDFVSNSSSSSFIVATDRPQQELFDFIVRNTHDKNSKYWDDSTDSENMKFLQEHFNNYVQLVIGDFEVVDEKGGAMSLEESEEDSEECCSLCNCVVPTDDIKAFIENGVVKAASYRDFLEKGKYPTRYYMSYRIYEITQDSIDFTRWLINQCATRENSPELVAYYDYIEKTKVWSKLYLGEKLPKGVLEEARRLRSECYGLLISPSVSDYVKENGEWKRVGYPLHELLDRYEKYIKEGKRIYRFCAGYSGEGEDFDSYIWVDSCKFTDVKQDVFKFENDPWW